jgi:hypothetical protein
MKARKDGSTSTAPRARNLSSKLIKIVDISLDEWSWPGKNEFRLVDNRSMERGFMSVECGQVDCGKGDEVGMSRTVRTSLDDRRGVSSEPSRELDLEHVRTAIDGIRYGEVRVMIQDGVIVQIERVEKQRLR